METIEKPTMMLLKIGKTFKVLSVTGKKGMTMPSHHSTKEAIIIVQEGSAVLTMANAEYVLQKEEVFIIPAGEQHSLSLKSDFKAIAIMEVDSNIEFNKN